MCPNVPFQSKLNANIIFVPSQIHIKVLPGKVCILQAATLNSEQEEVPAGIPDAILKAVTPEIWAQGKPGQDKTIAQVQIRLQERAIISHLK